MVTYKVMRHPLQAGARRRLPSLPPVVNSACMHLSVP